MRDGQEKWIVREAFADMLPDYIRRRPKNPMSHSSGLHERARLYKPLFARESPVATATTCSSRCAATSRSCSSGATSTSTGPWRAIDARPDYTALEHARDLLGAVRWNATTAARTWPPADRSPPSPVVQPERMTPTA